MLAIFFFLLSSSSPGVLKCVYTGYQEGIWYLGRYVYELVSWGVSDVSF